MCHAVSHLAGGCFSSQTSIRLRYARLTEILLGENIGSHLAPMRWNHHDTRLADNIGVQVERNTGPAAMLCY